MGATERAKLASLLSELPPGARSAALALRFKDVDTFGHCVRVSAVADAIGRSLGLSEAILLELRQAALVHDVGKIGQPDAVLRKPAKLTEEELESMRGHPEAGALILAASGAGRLAVLVLRHHERVDGQGYPGRRFDGGIPEASRIIAVADSYDALRSARRYHGRLTRSQTMEIILSESGTKLDPDACDALARIEAEWPWPSGEEAPALA